MLPLKSALFTLLSLHHYSHRKEWILGLPSSLLGLFVCPSSVAPNVPQNDFTPRLTTGETRGSTKRWESPNPILFSKSVVGEVPIRVCVPHRGAPKGVPEPCENSQVWEPPLM